MYAVKGPPCSEALAALSRLRVVPVVFNKSETDILVFVKIVPVVHDNHYQMSLFFMDQNIS
jgi:hypothetical protein